MTTKSRIDAAKEAMQSQGLILRKASSVKWYEEKSIARSCQELASIGFGLDRWLVGRVIHDYLLVQERETPFKDGIPGQKWWTGFVRRWPSLSERKPQLIEQSLPLQL